MKHLIVVGSGIAGLIAALEASRGFHVTLVTKARLADSNTRWAQGGIAAAMSADDSVAEHIADTLQAGAGLCNPAAVKVLCEEGPERIRNLIELGVDFDLHDGELARGLEAAHSHARVLHAGGDATGLSIELALVRAVRAAPSITVREHTFARDLVLHQGRVQGLEILALDGNSHILAADAVILASGGAGQLYLHTTNPAVATGDGVAMALRAGAVLADTEFYQFHPTALATPGTFLISEAVRGEGAVLRDRHGRRFMQDLDPRAELAPRDVVARGIARQMQQQQGEPVVLDATALGAAFLATRFPTIDQACADRGLHWATQPIPVTPAAHYWMGGVQTDLFGRTSVPGLYAVGEVACTGVHGANRLASNSLLESLVFAWRCARRLLSHGTYEPAELPHASVTPIDLTPNPDAQTVTRTQLRTMMWEHAGIERTAAGLHQALQCLHGWRSDGSGVEARETRNLLQLAQVLVTAALARQESRGGHFRADFPATDPAFAHSLPYALAPGLES